MSALHLDLFLLIRLSVLSVNLSSSTPVRLLYVVLPVCLSMMSVNMLLRCLPPPFVSTYFFPPLQSVCQSVFYNTHPSICTYFFHLSRSLPVTLSVFYDAHPFVCTYVSYLSVSLFVNLSSTMKLPSICTYSFATRILQCYVRVIRAYGRETRLSYV
jgi:hypothetical protein